MSVKVNGKKLHLTTFEIPTSGYNLRKCLVAQKEFAEAEEKIDSINTDDDKSIVSGFQAQIDLLDTYMNFLKPLLHLSDDQVKKIENADFNDVVEFVNDIIGKVLGYSPEKSEKSKAK